MLPNWLPSHLLITAFLQICQAVVYASTIAGTDDAPSNVFATILDFISFTAVTGTGILDIGLSLVLFLGFTMPYLFLLASYLFKLFNSELGTITAVAVGAAVFLIALF